MRFGRASFADKNRIELRNRWRSKDESLKTLHIDIRRLSALAYLDTDHKTRELISCDHFIDALGDPELALKIRERQPVTLTLPFRLLCNWRCGPGTVNQSRIFRRVWPTQATGLSQSLIGGRRHVAHGRHV